MRALHCIEKVCKGFATDSIRKEVIRIQGKDFKKLFEEVEEARKEALKNGFTGFDEILKNAGIPISDDPFKLKSSSESKKINRDTPAYKGLYKETKRLIDIANKRIDRLEKSDVSKASYGLKQVQEHTVFGGDGKISFSKKFSIKNKSYNELVQLKAEVQKFLDYKTSTVTGTRQLQKKQQEILGLKGKPDPKFLDEYWHNYDKVMKAIENRGEKRFINYLFVMQKVKETMIDNIEKEENFDVDKVLESLTYEKASEHQEYTWNPEWFTE